MKTFCLLAAAFAAVLLLNACGSSTPAQVAGAWDFTLIPTGTSATNAANGGPGGAMAIEAVLSQSNGNITGAGELSDVPVGNLWFVYLQTTTLTSVANALAATTNVGFEYFPGGGEGDGCAYSIGDGGGGDGSSNVSGTVSGDDLKLAFSDGGAILNFTGTYNSKATPPTISGTVAGNFGDCPNFTATVTGVMASSLTGTYVGTVLDNGVTYPITYNLTEDSSGNLTVTGNSPDPKIGNISGTGTATANAFAMTATYPGHNATYGYFDPSLGAKGAILLMEWESADASVNCSNGGVSFSSWCPATVGALAKQ
jgi:hypothetical protein